MAMTPGLRSPEQQQLTRLYQRWRQPLLRLFQGRLGSRAHAEDATQDLFMRLAVSGKQLAPEEEQPYLSVAARNVCTDRWRRSGQGLVPDSLPLEQIDQLAAPAAHDSCLELAAQRQRLERLAAAVQELPARQRQAFLLHRIDGLRHDEVAAAMGISPRMVAKHLQRALAYCQLRVLYPNLQQMDLAARLHLPDEAEVAERP